MNALSVAELRIQNAELQKVIAAMPEGANVDSLLKLVIENTTKIAHETANGNNTPEKPVEPKESANGGKVAVQPATATDSNTWTRERLQECRSSQIKKADRKPTDLQTIYETAKIPFIAVMQKTRFSEKLAGNDPAFVRYAEQFPKWADQTAGERLVEFLLLNGHKPVSLERLVKQNESRKGKTVSPTADQKETRPEYSQDDDNLARKHQAFIDNLDAIGKVYSVEHTSKAIVKGLKAIGLGGGSVCGCKYGGTCAHIKAHEGQYTNPMSGNVYTIQDGNAIKQDTRTNTPFNGWVFANGKTESKPADKPETAKQPQVADPVANAAQLLGIDPAKLSVLLALIK